MTQKEKQQIASSPIKRLQYDTPKFFRKLRLISLLLGGALGGISAYILDYTSYDKIGAGIATAASIFMVLIPLVCSFAVDFDKLIKEE